jgi:hypothetical protein
MVPRHTEGRRQVSLFALSPYFGTVPTHDTIAIEAVIVVSLFSDISLKNIVTYRSRINTKVQNCGKA